MQERIKVMAFFDFLKKKKAPAPAAAPAAANAASATAGSTPNSASALATGGTSQIADLGAAVSERNAAKPDLFTRLTSPVEKLKDKALGVAQKGADKVSGSKLVNAYDYVANKLDDFHDWRKERGKKKAAKKEAKRIEKEKKAEAKRIKKEKKAEAKRLQHELNPTKWDKFKDSVKEKASAAGGWMKDKASKAGSFIGDKASKVGNFVKDKASKAGDFLDKKANAVKDWASSKYEGSLLQKGVNKVAEKGAAAGNWMKDKAKAAGNWINDKYQGSGLQRAVWSVQDIGSDLIDKGKAVYNRGKDWLGKQKEDITDWIDKQKDAFHRHDDERYQRHRAQKRGADYLNNKAMLNFATKNGAYAERAAHRADVDYLGSYDEASRSYGGSGGEVEDSRSILQTMTDDKQGMIDKGIAVANKAGSSLAKGLIKRKFAPQIDALSENDPARKILEGQQSSATGAAGAFIGAAASAAKAGVHGYRSHQLGKISNEDLAKNVDPQKAELLELARSMAKNKQNREVVTETAGAIGGVAKGVGNLVDYATGTKFGSMAGKGVDLAAKAAAKYKTGKMRDKENWQMVKGDLFGSDEEYKALKHSLGMSKRDMMIRAQEMTGARNVNDIAERIRLESSQATHSTLGGEEDSGGDAIMEALGHSKRGRNNMSLEDVQGELDSQMNYEKLKRRAVNVQ